MLVAMTIIQSINDAMREAMRADDTIVILGEDVGKKGGVFLATEGLYNDFGPERVIDTPLSELGLVGVAMGMSVYGLRPIAEIQFADFIYSAFDQIVSQLSKIRFRTSAEFKMPLVIRTPYGGGVRGGVFHSQSPMAYFVHTPGLTVVVPSNPYDAKGLLISAIKNYDPVIFFEPKRLYRTTKAEVPQGLYEVPIGKAKLVSEGDDVTLVAYGSMVEVCENVVSSLANRASVDLIDLRTLLPYDAATILQSVRKTGRVVIVHEESRTCGFGAEISALIAEKSILDLKSPIIRVTGLDTPVPLSYEQFYLPSPADITDAIDIAMKY